MVLIYKCPNCGGNMTFDPEKQLLHCDYCGNESKVEDVETEEREDDVEQNLSNTKVYECPNCGGKIIEKKSKRGKVFYCCNNYPTCQTAYWDKPINELCPNCNAMLTEKNGKVKCSSCKYCII